MTSASPYHSNLEHLLDEMRRLDLLLALALGECQPLLRRAGNEQFRGLYISEQEIDEMLGPRAVVDSEALSDADGRVAALSC